jgi:DNA-binding GntR family transcriptional regulator
MSNISAVSTAAPTREAASLSEKAYYAIRDMIVSLDLPPGAVIDERQLMQRLRIGRTPTREALRRLSQEKLVDVYPRRGMFVTGVDVRHLAQLSEVRVILEPEAARLAALRASEPDRELLTSLLAELDDPRPLDVHDLIELDERIHRAIYRCTRNRFLEATLEEYFVLALRLWYLALDRTQELKEAVLELRALLEAIRDGAAERAADLMRVHVQDFEQAMRRVLVTV